MEFLDMCALSRDMSEGTVDKCFGWVYTFQCMHLLDRDVSWLDDGSWEATDGCWESSVWPAGQDIGNGSLLKFLETVSPLLHRCAVALSRPPPTESSAPAAAITPPAALLPTPSLETDAEGGTESSQTAADVMRYAECVGECLRVVSAVLKPRRGAIVPATDSSGTADAWDEVSDSILRDGCVVLSSQFVSKVLYLSVCRPSVYLTCSLSVLSVCPRVSLLCWRLTCRMY